MSSINQISERIRQWCRNSRNRHYVHITSTGRGQSCLYGKEHQQECPQQACALSLNCLHNFTFLNCSILYVYRAEKVTRSIITSWVYIWIRWIGLKFPICLTHWTLLWEICSAHWTIFVGICSMHWTNGFFCVINRDIVFG